MNQRKLTDYVLSADKKGASASTRLKNTTEAYRAGVAGKKSSEYTFASCGCCKSEIPEISNVWDQKQYQFLMNEYDINSEHLRVHPALWNNGTNNVLSGVFEVLPGKIYQVRGYDMANITFVKANKTDSSEISKDDHWVVMDTLMSTECTEEALKLFNKYLSDEFSDYKLTGNIVGMIISHSHVDHYGGMSTVKSWFVNDETAELINAEGKEKFKDSEYPRIDVPFILAPNGFFEHSVSENVYAGNAMGRRASYQYGSFIKPTYSDESSSADDYLSGEISIGIGQGQSTGSISFEIPTMEISENVELILDELTVQFQLTPGTEAPAEMNTYFPDYKALWLAENCNGTLHNLYTLRGAQVRDGKAWANYLMETVALYGDDAQVIFQSHNWPHWCAGVATSTGGTFPETDLRNFLIDTAAIYKYINDQTLLYMNMGYKMNEASDMLTLPRAMQKNWCLKPFYGTPKHNAKAVYQKYLGWYDANPIHLEELPPELLAKEQLRYLESISSGKTLLDIISTDINNGNYWMAAYMANQIIMANKSASDVSAAKLLCADALEQLGYQCESGTWRNAHLAAAYELREGKGRVSASGGNMMSSMTTEMILDYISIIFDGERGSNISFDGYLSVKTKDDGVVGIENFLFAVRNGAILYSPVLDLPDSDNSSDNSEEEDVEIIEVNKEALSKIVTGDGTDDLSGVLLKIFYCVVRFGNDRYKYFDIMTRHDSEVKLTSGSNVDLRDYVYSCIALLESYVSVCEGLTGTTAFSGADQTLWNDFYDVLKVQTGVILDGDFFDPTNSEAGIGTDGKFYAYELYYALYSLYRYLTNYYIKNDVCIENGDYSAEIAKLKKTIALLESYVSDVYLGNYNSSIQFESDDFEALNYANGNDYNLVELGIADFFSELYKAHKRLAELLELKEDYIPFEYMESATSLKLSFDEENYYVICGESKYEQSGTIDISDLGDTIIFDIYKKTSSGTAFLNNRIIFHKPTVDLKCTSLVSGTILGQFQDGDLSGFADTEIMELEVIVSSIMPYNVSPDPAPSNNDKTIYYVLEYKTEYATRLVIAGGECSPGTGRASIPSKAGAECKVDVYVYSEFGYYVHLKYDCVKKEVVDG